MSRNNPKRKRPSHRPVGKMKILDLVSVILTPRSSSQQGLQTKKDTQLFFSMCWTAAETAEMILLKTLILQVICLYQKVVPHLVSQCKFDFSKLFKGNFVLFFKENLNVFKNTLKVFFLKPVQELCLRKVRVRRFHQFCNSKFCSWLWTSLRASSPGSAYR